MSVQRRLERLEGRYGPDAGALAEVSREAARELLDEKLYALAARKSRRLGRHGPRAAAVEAAEVEATRTWLIDRVRTVR